MKNELVVKSWWHMARGFRFEAAPRLTGLWLLPFLTISFFALPARADQIKANNASNLETGASWVSGVPPTAPQTLRDRCLMQSVSDVPTNNRFYRVRIQ